MKSTKKRIIIVFAILTMAIILSCAFVACDKAEPDKEVCGRRPSEGLEYYWNSDENGYTVTEIGTCTDKELIIPSEYNAKPVTSIGSYAFLGCEGLTSVTIGGSVTSIGDEAFSYCRGLTSVTIGNSVTSIGSYAFRGCTGLTNITIGNSVTSIGDYAFYGCDGLTSITIPNSVTSIGSSAFSGCTGLTSITIPNSVTSIGSFAFDGCTGLTNVKIGKGVTSIGWCAFAGCTGLTSIKFNGTKAQWNAISKGSDWKYRVPATQVICTDGTVSIW